MKNQKIRNIIGGKDESFDGDEGKKIKIFDLLEGSMLPEGKTIKDITAFQCELANPLMTQMIGYLPFKSKECFLHQLASKKLPISY